jgi:O-antigen/teichoic acid export membrane protein
LSRARFGLLKAGAVYTVANVLSGGVQFLLLPVLTRALDPHQYGEVVAFFVVVTVCSSAAGLCLHGAVAVRWLGSEVEPRQYTGSAIALAIISTALTAVAAAGIGSVFDFGIAPAWCALAAVVAGTVTLQGMRFAVWQCTERPVPAATLQVSSATLNIGLSLLGVFALGLGGAGRIFGAVAAGVGIAAYSVYHLAREGAATRPSSADFTGLLRFGLPLVPHALGGSLLASADRLAVAASLGTAALGIYGTAYQLGAVVIVLGDAVSKAYQPSLYRMLSRHSMRARLRVVAFFCLSVPFWLAVAGLLWLVFEMTGSLLLGRQYLDAIDLSIWFLCGAAFSAIYQNIAGLFFFTGKTEWLSVATGSTAVLALAVAPFAVERFGIEGGALTYLSVQLALTVAVWTLSLRVYPMPWRHAGLALRLLLRRRPRGVQLAAAPGRAR